MPSTTRSSSSSAIRFPSSKQHHHATAKKPSPSSSSSASKPDAITLLFRREVQSLLSTVPALPSHVAPDAPVHVVACVERLSLSGIQQSVQLCQAGDETWVTRTEGARQYFPRAGRVQKRLRGAADDPTHDDDDVEAEAEVEPGADRDEDERVTIRKKKSKKSHRASFETPRAARPLSSPSSSSLSSSRRRSSDPTRAPHKKAREPRRVRRDRDDDDDEYDDDDGANSTETEHSHLARTRRRDRAGSAEMLTSIGEEDRGAAGVEPPLGRGHRRCSGRNSTPQDASASASSSTAFKVKTEDGGDDLASLCGRVGGLEFRSTVDPESEYERTPAPASADIKGKGRA
ncbi:hypothetical protein JCM11491_000723 [Sporobolomyces phaffii]